MEQVVNVPKRLMAIRSAVHARKDTNLIQRRQTFIATMSTNVKQPVIIVMKMQHALTMSVHIPAHVTLVTSAMARLVSVSEHFQFMREHQFFHLTYNKGCAS